MGQMLGKQSPLDVIEQAHNLKTDPIVLDVLRDNIVLSGKAVTMFPMKTALHPSRLVYSGDLSADDASAKTQIRPLLILDYSMRQHAATVRHGITGESLMMLVREPCDVGYVDGGKWFSCSCGGETEARLYANGTPVAVNVSVESMTVAPPSQPEISRSRQRNTLAGSSMVELLKHKGEGRLGNRIHMYSLREGPRSGQAVAACSKVGGRRVSVFKMLDTSAADPLTTLVMAWYTSIDNS